MSQYIVTERKSRVTVQVICGRRHVAFHYFSTLAQAQSWIAARS